MTPPFRWHLRLPCLTLLVGISACISEPARAQSPRPEVWTSPPCNDACRQQNLPFGLIYWSSGYPSLLKRGLADDSTW